MITSGGWGGFSGIFWKDDYLKLTMGVEGRKELFDFFERGREQSVETLIRRSAAFLLTLPFRVFRGFHSPFQRFTAFPSTFVVSSIPGIKKPAAGPSPPPVSRENTSLSN